MSLQLHIPKSGRNRDWHANRGVARLMDRPRRAVTENMKTYEAQFVPARVDGNLNEKNRIGIVVRHKLSRLSQTDSRDVRLSREAAATITRFRSASSSLVLAERSHPTGKPKIQTAYRYHQPTLVKTHNKSIREIAAVLNENELPGTSTHDGARLSFVRGGGVQMFRDAANNGLLRRDWLFHQKSREHRGSSFVEPLFEEGIDFLFQI
jgi:hypothetical protein